MRPFLFAWCRRTPCGREARSLDGDARKICRALDLEWKERERRFNLKPSRSSASNDCALAMAEQALSEVATVVGSRLLAAVSLAFTQSDRLYFVCLVVMPAAHHQV